jgi:chromosome segregation ATPase
MPGMPTTLAELEARIAALEAERADYRAVLAAVSVLGENQREHGVRLGGLESRLDGIEGRLDKVETRLDQVESKLDDTSSRVRSIEENLAEVKDLLVRALDGR